jgi:hypothetical protein
VITNGPAGVEDEEDDDEDDTAAATAGTDSGGALSSAVAGADARVSSVGGSRGSPVPLRLASTSVARGPGCHTRGGLREGPPRRGPCIEAVADSTNRWGGGGGGGCCI